MRYSNTEYKGFTIQQRVDVPSHTCIIYKGGDMVKCIAGDIFSDGSSNAVDKAKAFIDSL